MTELQILYLEQDRGLLKCGSQKGNNGGYKRLKYTV